MSNPQLLRLSDVQHLTGLGRSAIYAQMAAGTFPACIKIGARAAAWSREQVEEWIAARIRDGRVWQKPQEQHDKPQPAPQRERPADRETRAKLKRHRMELRTAADMLYAAAVNVERAMLSSGADPKDYTLLDIYRLAMPLAMHMIVAAERAGRAITYYESEGAE